MWRSPSNGPLVATGLLWPTNRSSNTNMLTDRKNRRHLESPAGSLKIGLIGDLFLDRYLELVPGHHELSIETGLEAYQIFRVRNSPGALGTVMNNLAALGVGRLIPVTVLGDDGHGYDLLQELKKLPVDLSGIVTDKQRLTPTYTKPMRQDESGDWQELNRIDVRSREPLNAACTAQADRRNTSACSQKPMD